MDLPITMISIVVTDLLTRIYILSAFIFTITGFIYNTFFNEEGSI